MPALGFVFQNHTFVLTPRRLDASFTSPATRPNVLGSHHASDLMRRVIFRYAAFLTVSMLSLCSQPVLNTASVLNASGYQNQLAPDTVFVIFGSGLGPAAIATASAPYPTSVGGTSVTFTPTTGGTAIVAKMVY